ncbi:PREDICTED: fumarylacetoacetate hydrolase domain-containing protein 2-like [Papilio polytes]|uniref:fumarylacetoacetate hydrolase domain-containing protein 2-like n=1 Tax=Papilio polytes TaxID=76194 RepID=UPI0006768E0D|nr:PREDICTED: fumarylacetoacetate hydrolase domain-containing protein 2-like [Papilio polytes]
MTYILKRAITSIKSQFPLKNYINKSSAFEVNRHFSVGTRKNMKLVQFSYKDCPCDIHVGYLIGDNLVEVNKADPTLPYTLLDILKTDSLHKVRKIVCTNPDPIPLNSVNLVAPIHGMDKVLCVGLNYKDHCEEQNLKPPEVPIIFSKFSSTVIGPGAAVRLRESTKQVDWEVELAVVIGRTATNVKACVAYDYVLGYTVAQDISARDWQKSKNGGQFLLGKSMDTFCPIGPCITTQGSIGDPENLTIQCSVNGEQKQCSNTDQLIHKIPDIIERLTSVMTLLPGDIILTGTPGGVGMYRDPPEYLKPGDVICSEIENIGVLVTKVERF